ncbi:hypothetical protein ABC977_06310 [Thioalkalicoccus limnaeus]|uniref:Uncharacterized protein n=1 Tax=Thioalkalicoccus limnaeus TaxID=120681 RepID=A0ABV4BCK7_9GAMM
MPRPVPRLNGCALVALSFAEVADAGLLDPCLEVSCARHEASAPAGVGGYRPPFGEDVGLDLFPRKAT